jgi:beta-glucosidase
VNWKGIIGCSFLKKRFLVLTGVCLSSVTLFPAYSQSTASSGKTKTVLVYEQSNLPIETRLADLLGRMTLEEKVRQLDFYSGTDSFLDRGPKNSLPSKQSPFSPAKADALLGGLGAGAIHDLDPTPEQYNTIQKWVLEHTRLHIPALFIEEGLHGFDTGTVFPAPLNLASTWDPSVAEKTGSAIAAEARATGVGMILAPVLDLARDPRWGRIEEDFGEDPYLTGQMGLAYVRGAQGGSLNTDHNVVAEPKHFAAHGSPEGGTNTSPVHIGERELRSVMLKSFEPSFREGHAMATMAAYHEIDGIPVTADPYLLKTILRQEWGFQGLVLSDLGAIRRLYQLHQVASSPKAASCLAIKSGVDMQFYDFDHDVFQKALIDCVHEGSLPQADVDRAASAVLRLKFALGLFDHPYIDPTLNAKTYRSKPHLDVSLQSARESLVLLKNENGLLPLSKSVQRIAVIGPNADVARYGDYEEESHGFHISILQGIKAEAPHAQVEFDSGKDIDSAVAKAKSADVVIMGLGEWQGISGESFDRTSLDLPGEQEKLLEAIAATNKPVVLVLENGRPLTISWAKAHVGAIVEAWYPGEFGGQAIAETLFGDNNPAGRLTITFPQTVGQIPDYYNTDPSRAYDSDLTRKKVYVDNDSQPLFPFGYGLSYTTFHYGDLQVTAPAAKSNEDVSVTFTVTNTGSRAGDEVSQVYLREQFSSVETPVRSLKAFTRIALQPQESRVVTLKIPRSELAVWNADEKWAVEGGKYTVWVGGSSAADMSKEFELQP